MDDFLRFGAGKCRSAGRHFVMSYDECERVVRPIRGKVSDEDV